MRWLVFRLDRWIVILGKYILAPFTMLFSGSIPGEFTRVVVRIKISVRLGQVQQHEVSSHGRKAV